MGLRRTFFVQHPQKNKDMQGAKKEVFKREIRKMQKLQHMLDQAPWYQRFLIQAEIIQQKQILSEAQDAYTQDYEVAQPTLRDGENPLDAKVADNYRVMYAFMLEAFLRECKEFSRGAHDENAEDLTNDIVRSFEDTHPNERPPTNEEVEMYFNLFYSLANNVVFLDEVRFRDPTVAKFLLLYVSMEPTDDAEEVAANAAQKMNTSKDVVMAWYSVFEILSSVPFAEGDECYTCAICPVEHRDFEYNVSDLGKLEKKMSKNILQGQDTAKRERMQPGYFFTEKGENRKGPSFDKTEKDERKGSHEKRNTEDRKPDQRKTDEKKKSGNGKKILEVEFNLNSPVRLFQIGLLSGLVTYFIYTLSVDHDSEISFQEFSSKFLAKNLVSKLIVVNNKTAYVELNENGRTQYPHQHRFYFNVGSVEQFERNLRAVQDEFNIADAMRIPVVYSNEGSIGKLIVNFLPTLLFLGAIYYMTKKATAGGMGGPLGFGKSTAKKFNQETDVKIRFKDVAGMSEAKEEVMEFVKFLQNPEKYEKLGAKIPRGAILSGPPGTGKTLIAKATAGEAGVPFYSVSGSEFVEMFVGVGASRVRDLFKTARENAPSIVFVDEIDAIGKQRSKGNASGANDERETTLNQLLVEMDGFDSTDHVVVLAGTNRADILDKALMRPGRFDRHIAIDNPELEGRKEIFQVHLKKIKLAKNIDKDLPGRLAALTPGFSGADIANVCNEAALIAARFNATSVSLRHFELAIERVIGGIEKKSKLLNPEEQRIVAFHEAGHAVCGWYLRYAHPLLKVSIIPRGQGALGYAQYLPPDQYLMSDKQLYDRMIMTLGGRASEELHFNSVTSGAHDDFKKVTNIAQSMVLRFGMSDKVGMVNYADTRSSDDLTKPFSDKTNKLIDEEVHRIVTECYVRCKSLLSERSKEVDLVAQELLKKEFITREDMIRLLGKRPFPETNDAFDKYLDGKAAFKNEPEPQADASA